MQAFKIPSSVIEIIHRFEACHFEAYIVGGAIRDLCRGRTPNDWDLCTNALPHEILSCFSDCKTYCVGKKYGTITLIWDHKPYEITTYRVDGDYQNARHPSEVRFVQSLTDDLSRRDFTINAMAYHPERGLIDRFHGQSDLKEGIIRTIGDPSKHFSEDVLRILRCLRIAACDHMQIERETARAAVSFAYLLETVSNERIFAECDRLLSASGEDVSKIFHDFYPIWQIIFPEIASDFAHWEEIIQVLTYTPSVQNLRWAMLFRFDTSIAQAVLERYPVEHKRLAQILVLIRHSTDPLPSNQREMRQQIANLHADPVRQLLQMRHAEITRNSAAGELQQIQQAEQLFKQTLTNPKYCFDRKQLAVNGNDLIHIGIEKGPRIGAILDTLFQLVINEELPNQRDVLFNYAKKL